MMFKPCKDCGKRHTACHDAMCKAELQAANDARKRFEDAEYMAHRRSVIERQKKGAWR